jgi:spore coat polysaccharide biosynthesis predicted glycosyltransferase SpsG
MKNKKIIIRVDALAEIGIGHFIRCKALAIKIMEYGVEVIFAIKTSNNEYKRELHLLGCSIHEINIDSNFYDDAIQTASCAINNQSDLIIADISSDLNVKNSKEFIEYFKVLNEYKFNIIVIDDLQKIDLPFTVQIIPYFGANNLAYKFYPNTKYLLGEAYYVVPQDFKSYTKRKVIKKNISNILITFGGSDNEELTIACIEAIEGRDSFRTQIVIGAYFSDRIKRYVEKKINPPYFIRYSKKTIYSGLIWADLALIGLGLTRYEAAIIGTPSLSITKKNMDYFNNDALIKSGIGRYLSLESEGNTDDILRSINQFNDEFEIREKMSIEAYKLIDKRGADRILFELRQLNLI